MNAFIKYICNLMKPKKIKAEPNNSNEEKRDTYLEYLLKKTHTGVPGKAGITSGHSNTFIGIDSVIIPLPMYSVEKSDPDYLPIHLTEEEAKRDPVLYAAYKHMKQMNEESPK